MGFVLCHAIGCDKETVWRKFRDIFLEVGDHGFDIDYTNYDGTQSCQGYNVVLAMMDKFYGGQRRSARSAVMRSITHSYIIAGRYVMQTCQGNKSGNAATDVFNSLANWYNVLVAFCASQQMAGIKRDLGVFDREVRCLTYGDDVIVSASDDVLQYFNRNTCALLLRVLGYVVTGASKEEDSTPFDPFEKLTFLKSRFVECDSAVMAPMPKKIAYRDLMWGKKRNDGDVEVMQMKVDAAVQMMCHHGEEETARLVDQLLILGWVPRIKYKQWLRELLLKQEHVFVETREEGEVVRVGHYFGVEEEITFSTNFDD